jgi:hypothetical protein
MLRVEAALAFALSAIVAGDVNVALFAGAVMLTVGAAKTVIATALDVVDWFVLSVATAVMEYAPDAGGVQLTVNGLDVFDPSEFPAAKNSTLEIVPPVSVAVAVSVTATPAPNVALFVGEVIETVGAGGCTEILTGVDVVTPPLLSVALAVSV